MAYAGSIESGKALDSIFDTPAFIHQGIVGNGTPRQLISLRTLCKKRKAVLLVDDVQYVCNAETGGDLQKGDFFVKGTRELSSITVIGSLRREGIRDCANSVPDDNSLHRRRSQ